MKKNLFTPLRQIPRQKRMVIEISVALSVISGTAAAAPSGGQITAGQAVINRNGGQTVINQTSNRAIINWRDFSTARGEGVTFNAPSVNSATLNRVTGNLPSRLDGSLAGNGRVFLINRNGIVVGANGVVNVKGGFVASTQDVKDQDFINGGDLTFSGNGGGKIQVLGTIRSESGDIVLIAPKIDNQGLLQSGRQINLVAANEVVMSDSQLRIKPRLDDAGELTSQGVIEAASVRLAASNQNFGALAINNSGHITANGVVNNGDGSVRITAQGAGGNVQNGGKITAGNGDKGGRIDITGGNVTIKDGAELTASGKNGGGAIHIGGGWQGKDAGLSNAQNTTIEQNVSIKADASDNGNGGEVVIWSDGNTRFNGQISAQGGAQGGNGGNVEVSGKTTLDYQGNVSTLAARGETGNLLLDPTDIHIVAGTGSVDYDQNVSSIGVDTLLGQLAGNNVTLKTSNGGTGTGNGDIFVDTAINYDITGARTLTLQADRDIFINSAINSQSLYTLTLDFQAARDIQFNQAVTETGQGNTKLTAKAGRDLEVNAPITTRGATGSSNSITLSTTTGDLTINSVLNSGNNQTSVNSGRDLFLNAAQDAGIYNLTGSAKHDIYVGGDINATNLSLTAALGKVAAFNGDPLLGTGTITFNPAGVNLAGTGSLTMLSGRTGPAGALENQVGDPVTLPDNVHFSTVRNGSLTLAFGSLSFDRPIQATSVALYSDNLTIGPNAGSIKATGTSGDILLQAGAYKKYDGAGVWHSSTENNLSTLSGPVGLLTVASGTGFYANHNISLYSSVDANGKRQGVITPDLTFQRYDGTASPFSGSFSLHGFDSIDLGQSINADGQIELYARDTTLRGDLISSNGNLTVSGSHTDFRDISGGRLHFRKNGLAEGTTGADAINLRAAQTITMKLGPDASGQRTSLTGNTLVGSSRANNTISGSVTLEGFDTVDLFEKILANTTAGYFTVKANTINVRNDLEIGTGTSNRGYELTAGAYGNRSGQLNFTSGTTLYYHGYDPTQTTTGPSLRFSSGDSPTSTPSDFSNVVLQTTSDYNGIAELNIINFGNIELDSRNKDGSTLTGPWSVRNQTTLIQLGQSGHILLPLSFDIGQGFEINTYNSTLSAQGAIVMGDQVVRLRGDVATLNISAGRTSSVNTDARLLRLDSIGDGQTLVVNVANNTTINTLGNTTSPGNIEVYARGDITLAGQVNRADSNPGSITLQADAQYGKTLDTDGGTLQTKDLNELFTGYNYGIQGEQGGDGLGAFQLSNRYTGATPLIVQPVFQQAYYVDYPAGFVVDAANKYYNDSGVAYAVGTTIAAGTLIYSNDPFELVSPKLEALNSSGKPMRYQRKVAETFTTGANDINIYFYLDGQQIPPGTYLLANTDILVKPGAPDTHVEGKFTRVNWVDQLYGITGYTTTTSYTVSKYTSLGKGHEANLTTAYSNLNFNPTTLGYDVPVNTADASSYFGKPTNGAGNSIGKTLNMSGQFYTVDGFQYAPTHYNEGASQVATGAVWDGWELSFGTGVLKVGQGNLTIISGPNDAAKGLPVDFNVHTNTFTANNSTTFGTYDPTTNRPFAFQLTSKGGDVTVLGFRDIGVSPSGTVSAGGNVTLGAARDLKIENSFILTADKTLTFLAGNAIWAKDGTTFGSIDPDNPLGTLVALAGKSVYLNSNVANLVGGLRESEADYSGSVAGGENLGGYNGKFTVKNSGALTILDDYTSPLVDDVTFTSNGILFTGGEPLSLSGIESTRVSDAISGEINISSGKSITVNGQVNALGNNLASNATLTALDGDITGTGLISGRTVTLTASQGQIDSITEAAGLIASAKNDIDLDNTGDTALTANSTDGKLTVDNSGTITLTNHNSAAGNAVLNATDSILSADLGSSLTADQISLDAGERIDVVTETDTLAARAADGDLAVRNTGDLALSAQAKNNLDVTTTGDLTVGAVAVTGGLSRSGVTSTTGGVGLHADGALNGDDVNAATDVVLTAGTDLNVTGIAAGSGAYLNGASSITASGDFGGNLSANSANGDIDLTSNGSHALNFEATAGGSASLNANSQVTVTDIAQGSVSAGTLDGGITVSSDAGVGGVSVGRVATISNDNGVVLDADVTAGQTINISSSQGAIEQQSGVLRAEEVNLTAQDGITGSTGWQNALVIEGALRVTADNTSSGDVILQNTVNGNNTQVSEVTLNNAAGSIRFDQRGGSSLAVNGATASGDIVLTATDGLANVSVRGVVDAGQSAAIVANKDLTINSGASVHAVDNLLLITDEAAGTNAGDGWLVNNGTVSVDSGNLAVYAVAGQASDGWISSHDSQVDLGNIADTFDLLHWDESFQGQGGDTHYLAGAGNSGVWYKVPLHQDLSADPVSPVNPAKPVNPVEWQVAQLLHGFYYGVGNARDFTYVQTYSIGFAADECLSEDQKVAWNKLAAQGEDTTLAAWRSVSYLARPTIVVPGSVNMQSMWRTQPSGSLQKPVCVERQTVALK